MTFAVTVAHFCEIHGPAMVMCTQQAKKLDDISSFYGAPIPQSQLCPSCRLQIPQMAQLETTTLTTTSEYSNRVFVSTQFPSDRNIYSSLRQIIMRVFTVETTVDITKPLMFGDSSQGYTLALCFKLYDKTARGSERKYALLVTSDKESDLLYNYTFILANLLKMVEKITSNAQRIYQLDNSKLNGDDMMSNNDIYLRRSTNIPKAKSMVEIMSDDDFFCKIHLWATFLLDKMEDE